MNITPPLFLHLSSFLSLLTFSAFPPSSRTFFTPWFDAPPGAWKLFFSLVFAQLIYFSWHCLRSRHPVKTPHHFQPNFFQEPVLPPRRQTIWISPLIRFLNLTFLLFLLIPFFSLFFD